jgi:hypothetical protein
LKSEYRIFLNYRKGHDKMNALSINNLTHGIPGGVMVIVSPAGVNLTGPLMGYARNLNIDLVHFFSMYKIDGN